MFFGGRIIHTNNEEVGQDLFLWLIFTNEIWDELVLPSLSQKNMLGIWGLSKNAIAGHSTTLVGDHERIDAGEASQTDIRPNSARNKLGQPVFSEVDVC